MAPAANRGLFGAYGTEIHERAAHRRIFVYFERPDRVRERYERGDGVTMPLPTQRTRKVRATVGGAALAALMGVSACAAGSQSQSQESLAGACQVTKCICADTSTMFWQAAQTVPIEWQPNGAASCPPGYALVRMPEEKKKKR